MLRIAALSSALLALTITPSSATEVTLYGAGSLAGVLGEVSAAYSRATGVVVHQQFGPSGMMRERIEKGAKVDVFASADLGHPRQLVADGRAGFVVRFTGNRLCAMAKPELGLTSANVLDKALDPTIKLGTSTPVADPGGDYTWKVFDRAEVLRPGAGVALKNKALKLVGGPQAEKIPAGRGAIPYLLETGKADLFIAYCTTGKQAAQESVALTVANLPAALTEIADYGLVVLKDAAPDAAHFALFMLSETGQAIFAKRGFEATLPRAEPK
jgi:molybdate transport system substrate-binding protein